MTSRTLAARVATAEAATRAEADRQACADRPRPWRRLTEELQVELLDLLYQARDLDELATLAAGRPELAAVVAELAAAGWR